MVVVLQSVVIVLHLVNEGQLDAMTLKLNDQTHLAAGIAATDILTAAPDSPCGIGASNLSNRLLRLTRKAQPATP